MARRVIEVDADVYQYLLDHTQEIGESASSILRRLLGIKGNGAAAESPNTQESLGERSRRLVTFVSSRLRGRNVTRKYLDLLGFLYTENKQDFDKVLAIQGRKRQYFGRSRSDIMKTGTSTHPRQIPGSAFWALTNADTSHKRDILARVLEALDYERQAIIRAVSSLR